MIDDFEKNQNNYTDDEELNNILYPDDDDQDSYRLKRSMTRSQKRRNVRGTQILITRLRKLIRFLITLALLYLTYRLMISSKWYLPKDTITSYKIKRIKIVGNRITPTYKIVSKISDIELPHKPIYMIKTNEFSKKISSLAPVKKVYVQRLWFPARIVIYIEEKEPILAVAPSEKVQPVAIFTRDGSLIGRDYLPLPQPSNTILVLSYGNQNDDYTKWDKNKILSIEKLVRTLEKYSGEQVEYIDMRIKDDIFVKLSSVTIRLGEFNANAYDRIKDIKSILKQTHSFEKKIKYIDLSWEDSKFIKLGNTNDTTKENSNSTNQ